MITKIVQFFKGLFASSEPEPVPAPVVQEFKVATPPKLSAKQRFQQELNKRNIKHFSADEVFYKGASNKKLGLNTEPPEELWDNIWKTIEVADKARAKHGKPIKIASAYRSPKYNKAIGGASKSQHVQFNALDLRTTAPKQLHKTLVELRDKGVFKGGLGLYKTFVHLDTRGTNADWRG